MKRAAFHAAAWETNFDRITKQVEAGCLLVALIVPCACGNRLDERTGVDDIEPLLLWGGVTFCGNLLQAGGSMTYRSLKLRKFVLTNVCLVFQHMKLSHIKLFYLDPQA